MTKKVCKKKSLIAGSGGKFTCKKCDAVAYRKKDVCKPKKIKN